jgi:uncharacterized protein (TIGR02118 family)
MIKVVTVLRRKPGMNLAAFTEYWRTTHAEAVKRVPEIRRYVQSQTIVSGYRTREPVYDGIAEIWYEDIGAMRGAAATLEAATALKDDDNFIDMKSFASIITDEVVQREAETDPSMVKLNEFVIRKPDSDPAAFHKYWTEVHGPLGATIKQMRRYVQSHVRPSAYRDGRNPFIDGVAQVWFDDTNAMRESAKTTEYAAVRADEPNFIDVSRLSFIITQERIIIG